MNALGLLTALGIGISLSFASAARRSDGDADHLGFHPAPGRSFTRTFREETAFEVASCRRRIDGTDLPDPAPSLSGEGVRELVAVDTFLEVEDERTLRLRRTFDSIEGSIAAAAELEGVEERHDADLESPLSGRSVEFAWDEDAEAFRCRIADEEPTPVPLADLRQDLDLTALLPDQRVAEGDSWSVDAGELEALLAPGGGLALHFGYEPDGPFELFALEELAAVALACLAENAAEAEGELDATWIATRIEDGERLAEIELELEATLEADASARWSQLLELSQIETERFETSLLTNFELEGEGRLVWDLDSGVFRELQMELRVRARLALGWRRSFVGRELVHELELALAGTSELSAECRPR